MRRLLARLRDDRGFSIIELSVAMILSAMVCASLVGVFYAFSQNTSDASARARLQADAREMIADIAVQLRQAIRADLNGEFIEVLTADRIVFYTTNHDTLAPERVEYLRTSCASQICELWTHRYAVSSYDGIAYTFSTTPFESSFISGGVLSDQAMFQGLDWVGSPPVRATVSACSSSGPECTFPIVGVTLRVRPINGATAGASTPMTLHQEVRMRNA